MRVIIEVRDETELTRVVAALNAASVEVTVGGDGGPAQAAPDIRSLLAATAGVWTAGDGLAYQTARRDEWDDR